ncbi:MAG: hypothetical protein MUE85_06980 [Microscillaceae bacterium]|jgi:hypothetical protein|nr:hypothetical protein [Microscillaceae bacterium]
MKKLWLLSIFCLVLVSGWAQTAKKIVVKSAIKGCWAAIISEEDAKKPENEFGWWSAWQRIKAEKKYKTTPATFKNVPKGKYVIVIYNPASKSFDPNAGIPEQASDGVVLQEVNIEESKTFSVEQADFKEWNCLSCPWLYVWNGQEFVRQAEIIQDIVGKKSEQNTYTSLSPQCVLNQRVRIRIQEEKDEISFLNQVVLQVNDCLYYPTQATLQYADSEYFTLKKGEAIELDFWLDAPLNQSAKLQIIARGYYEPDKKFLSEIYHKYLKTK